MRGFALACAVIVTAACAALPPAEPTSVRHGLLIARVEGHGALFRKSFKTADSAKIVALDAKGEPVPGHFAFSGFEANGYVLFLDMPAGRYVLRSASFPARGARYHLEAPLDGEAKRAVDLAPGTEAYLGDHGFDSVWPDFGEAMLRAGKIIIHWFTPFLKRPSITREAPMHFFEKGPVQETRALLAVRDSLAGTQWAPIINKRLRELSAAEPVKVEGAFRSKELPLREEPLLSWRDTLKWGEPRRAPTGLAWKRPGGEAMIVVFFTTATTPGFQGFAEAVSELRRSAAGSVEDAGATYEVRVATRAGVAARATKYRYAEGSLVGSETQVIVTETTLVPDGWGIYTARLRAPKAEFDSVVPAYREFLLQLTLGPPKPKVVKKQDVDLPFQVGP